MVPHLFVNKVDCCSLELQMEPEDMYGRLKSALENVNVIIATYNDALMGDVQVAPEKVRQRSARMGFQRGALCEDLRVEEGR